MAQGKLSEIIAVLYDAIEALTPHFDATALFRRWKMREPLEEGDVATAFRNFRIAVVATRQGPLPNQRDKRSRSASLQIQINYPEAYFPVGDTDYLGVENLRADDGRIIEDALCHRRPDVLQAAFTSVGALRWEGSFLMGRLWCINVAVDWMETT